MGAHDIGRHQVWRKLYAGKLGPQYMGQCLSKKGLAQSRDSFQQHVTPCKETHKQQIDYLFLTDNNLKDFRRDLFHNLFDFVYHVLSFSNSLYKINLPPCRSLFCLLKGPVQPVDLVEKPIIIHILFADAASDRLNGIFKRFVPVNQIFFCFLFDPMKVGRQGQGPCPTPLKK